MNNPPPDIRLASAIAASAGGVLWAMANAFGIAFAPNPPTSRDKAKAIYESLGSVIAAFIGGYFVAPAIVVFFKVQQTDFVSLIGLCVGLSFWQSVPLLSKLITKFTLKKAEALGNTLT